MTDTTLPTPRFKVGQDRFGISPKTHRIVRFKLAQGSNDDELVVCFDDASAQGFTFIVDGEIPELVQKSWTIEEAIQNQRDLCAEKSYPHFAPYDGRCYGCGGQIYTRNSGRGLVTGCPHCHKSYCD